MNKPSSATRRFVRSAVWTIIPLVAIRLGVQGLVASMVISKPTGIFSTSLTSNIQYGIVSGLTLVALIGISLWQVQKAIKATGAVAENLMYAPVDWVLDRLGLFKAKSQDGE